MKLIYKISRFLLVGVAFTSLNSCNNLGDDLLTQENPNKVTTDTFWQNLDDCDTGLTAVYKTFSDQNIYLNYTESLRADLGYPGVYPAWTPANSVFYTQTFNDATDQVGTRWSALYTGIFRANQVIEALENLSSESSSERWKLIMGQARFLRGLFHYYLNIAYNNGNVPIMSSAPATIEEFLQPSSASYLVKEFYRADLEYAEANLPEVGSADEWTRENGDMGRVTSGAASAVLGTSYLYDEDYATARSYFEKIINNSSYSLAPTCQDNFGLLNEFNTESILEVNYTTDYNTEYGQWDWRNLTTSYNLNFASTGGDGWGSIFASYWLYRDFVYEPVDKRNSDNKVYLECDEHGDILYYGKKIITSSTSGGKSYNSYLVLRRELVKQNDMTFYMKKVEVDSYGNSVIEDLSTLSDDERDALYSDTSSASFPIRAYSNMSAEELITVDGVTQQTGECWNVYFDSDDNPYRYKVHSDRASSSILMPTEWDKPYYQNDMSPSEFWSFSNATNAYRKFSNWETLTSEKLASAQERSAINNRIIRLADIYLMYAEALIEGGTNDGGVTEALKYINRVRKRAGTVLIGKESLGEFVGVCTYQDSEDPDIYAMEGAETYTNLYRRVGENYVIETASQVMTHLMYKERPLELCCEGYSIRFTDLRRWGILKERFTELSSEPFYRYGFQYYKTNQTTPASTNHWNWALDDGSSLPSAAVQYEYKNAAASYSDSKAYMPIPNSETTANPQVNNVIGL